MTRLTWPVYKRRWGTNAKQNKRTAAETAETVTEHDSNSSCGPTNNNLRLVTCDDNEDPRSKAKKVAIKPTNNSRGRRRVSQFNVLSYLDHSSIITPKAKAAAPQGAEGSQKNKIYQTYKVLPQIEGEGTAGTVRQCIHRPTSKMCAVKTITKSQTKRKDRIAREITFLKEVKHPNIIQVFDVYEDQEEVHIVTELCQGGELFDKIVEKARAAQKRDNAAAKKQKTQQHRRSMRRGSNKQVAAISSTTAPAAALPQCFCEKDAARIIHSLLSAVSYLHSKDIVHRDIKPENILFKEENDEASPIKLIDFGLAIKHTRECKKLTNSVGTAYYMSPEVLASSYDRSCDLWSVGVVAYILLSGRPPFNGKSNEDIFDNIKKGQFKMEGSAFWDTGVSKEAKDFIRGLLNVDAKRRWSAERALEHKWLRNHAYVRV